MFSCRHVLCRAGRWQIGNILLSGSHKFYDLPAEFAKVLSNKKNQRYVSGHGACTPPGCVFLHFNGHFPGRPGLAVSILDFVRAKDDGGSGDSRSYKTYKAPVKSSPLTNQHPVCLHAELPSRRPTNSVRALKVSASPGSVPQFFMYSFIFVIYEFDADVSMDLLFFCNWCDYVATDMCWCVVSVEHWGCQRRACSAVRPHLCTVAASSLPWCPSISLHTGTSFNSITLPTSTCVIDQLAQD